MNLIDATAGNLKSPFFPLKEIVVAPERKKKKGESSSSEEESSEEDEEEPEIQSLLMPLRRFHFVEKHEYRSYAPSGVVTGR